MIVKVVGMQDSLYKEVMYDGVESYVFTNEDSNREESILFSGGGNPFSHLTLLFTRKDPVHITFNTRAYIMTEETGKTIEVLHYNAQRG